MGIYRVMLTESREWESPQYTVLIQKTVLDILLNTHTVFLRTDKIEEFEYWKLFFKDVLKSKMTDEDVFANLVMKLIGKFNKRIRSQKSSERCNRRSKKRRNRRFARSKWCW